MKAIIHSIIPNGQNPGAVVSVWNEKQYLGTFVEPVVFPDTVETAAEIRAVIDTSVIQGLLKDAGIVVQSGEIKMLSQIFIEAETTPLKEQLDVLQKPLEIAPAQ